MTSHLTRCTVIGLAIAAFAAPTALAVPQTADHRATPQAVLEQDLRSPDTRDAAARVEARQDLRSPDTRDVGEGRGTYTAPNVMVVKVPATAPGNGGIDWADAGIGAGGLLALMLLGLGGALAVVHRRQAHAAAGI